VTIGLDFKDAVLSPPEAGLSVICAWPRNGKHGWNALIWDPAVVARGEPLEPGDLLWAYLPDPSFLKHREAA
jgi:hypothetical protein